MGLQRIQDVLPVVERNVRLAAYENALLGDIKQLKESVPGYLVLARAAVQRSMPEENLGGLVYLDDFEATVARVVEKGEKIVGK